MHIVNSLENRLVSLFNALFDEVFAVRGVVVSMNSHVFILMNSFVGFKEYIVVEIHVFA